MPRLPTAEELGPTPSLESRAGIATYDPSPLAKGAAALGQGAQNLGGALISIGVKRAEKDEAQAQTLEEAHAQADLLTDLAGRKRAIADAGDPNGLEQGQREAAQAKVDEIAASIKDPARAKLFSERARVQIDALGGLAKARADELTKDSELSAGNEKLSVLAKTAQQDKDLGNKEHYIDAGTAIIDGLASKGYISQVEAQRRKQQFAQDYTFEAVNALNPLQRLAVARGGVEGAVIQRESGGNYRVVNPFGYAGLYQFGAPLLSTLGLYKPGAGEDLQSWKDTGKDAPGKWSGTFNIPGYPGVRTLSDFRESPEAQRAAFQASTAYYDKEIDRRGLGEFIGRTVNGVPITREGIYAGAHLGGIAGTDNWLRGGVDHGDANGSKISGYVRMGSAAGPGAGDKDEPSIARYLTSDQRARLSNSGTRDLVTQERAAQNAQANEAATVKSLIRDDEASILTQGAPLATISPERVAASMGPAAAEEFARNRAQAVSYHDATADWNTIPLDQIRARLGSLKPAAGAQGFENADRLFSLAEKQADSIAKERRTDPAAAADRTPEVRAALQGASLDQPQSYQAVAKARAIAQDRLGIPESAQSLATKDELRALWKPVDTALKAGDEDKAHDVLKQTLERIGTAFGEENRKTVAAQMLAEAGATKAAAAMSMDILDELAKGQLLSREQARAYDKAKAQETARRNTQDWAPVDTTAQIDPETGRPVADIGYPSAPSYPTPTARAVEILRADPSPERIAAFNRPDRFGPGAAETVLKALGVPAEKRAE